MSKGLDIISQPELSLAAQVQQKLQAWITEGVYYIILFIPDQVSLQIVIFSMVKRDIVDKSSEIILQTNES